MFQRIQTIFLSGIVAFTCLLLYTTVLHFMAPQHIYEFNLFGLYDLSQPGKRLLLSSLPLAIAASLIIILALFALFFFKNRKRQLVMCKAILGLIVFLVVSGAYYFTTFRQLVVMLISPQEVLEYEIKFGNAAIMVIILAVLTLLSWRAIQKDEELVRSADRLR